jgi:hypothetical protein
MLHLPTCPSVKPMLIHLLIAKASFVVMAAVGGGGASPVVAAMNAKECTTSQWPMGLWEAEEEADREASRLTSVPR